MGATITATEFVEKLGSRDLPDRGLEVIGDVKLGNTPIDRPPSLAGTVFHGEVDFTGASIRGDIDFSRCTFIKRLDLRGVAVSGEILLNEVEIFGRGSLGNEPYVALDLSAAAVDGAVQARFLVVSGVLSGAKGKFKGGLDLAGSQIRQLNLQNAEVNGHFHLSSVIFPPNKVIWTKIDGIYAKSITVNGDVSFDRLSSQYLNLELATVNGDILAQATSYIRQINLDNSKIAGDLILVGETRDLPHPKYETNISGRGLKNGGFPVRLAQVR